MGAVAVRREAPASPEELAAALRAAGAEGIAVRPRGGGTKLHWGAAGRQAQLELSTERLDRVLEHNEGDLTAVIEAGLPLARAQEAFAAAGQRLALDPPLGPDAAATIGGIVASVDSGPLRHRYGAPRDLLLGMTVVLADGAITRSGGKVIKNVAGYDIAKLMAGSLGTLGVVLSVSVRLHPLPPLRLTAAGAAGEPAVLARAASALARSGFELEGLDLRYERDGGLVLARVAGSAAEGRVEAVAGAMRNAGLEASIVAEDEPLWERQREGQRSRDGTVLRVSATPAGLEAVIAAAARAGGTLVARAGVGLAYVSLPAAGHEEAAAAVRALRAELSPSPCVVLDAPDGVRERVDAWGEIDAGALELMRRVKRRFDPAGVLSPGVHVGGI